MHTEQTLTRRLLLAMALLPCAFGATVAEFPLPGKPIRVVVGFPPGGGTAAANRDAPHGRWLGHWRSPCLTIALAMSTVSCLLAERFGLNDVYERRTQPV